MSKAAKREEALAELHFVADRIVEECERLSAIHNAGDKVHLRMQVARDRRNKIAGLYAGREIANAWKASADAEIAEIEREHAASRKRAQACDEELRNLQSRFKTAVVAAFGERWARV